MTKLKKVYYQLKLSQISPLRIGNGENDISDNDLMCDSRGIPFIPGSSMAGVLREKYEKLGGKDPEKLFGIIKMMKQLQVTLLLVMPSVHRKYVIMSNQNFEMYQ